MLNIDKKERVMFSKYTLLILLALQILCCESVESAGVPRGMLPRADSISRTRNVHRRRELKVKTTTNILASADTTAVSTKILPPSSSSSSSSYESEPEVTLNAFDLCLCGAFATAFGDFVMHPVDTIKVSQQVISQKYISSNIFSIR